MTATDYEICAAGLEDVPCLAECIMEFGAYLANPMPPEQKLRADLAMLLQDRNTDFLVARGKVGGIAMAKPGDAISPIGECLGFLQQRYRYTLWNSGEEMNLEDLYVRPRGRGRGIGHALVEHALARAVSRGCRRAVLEVNENNMAKHLYERFGFRSEQERPMPGRQLFMVKPL